MAKNSSPRRPRTNSSPPAWPDIMLPSPRSRIGNPFLKSSLFVSGVSAMIYLPTRFRYWRKFKMPTVIEPMVRFILLAKRHHSGKPRQLRGHGREPECPLDWRDREGIGGAGQRIIFGFSAGGKSGDPCKHLKG